MTEKIVSRQEARERGLTRYFTGRPCKSGHVCERRVTDKKCLECQRQLERRRDRRPEPSGRTKLAERRKKLREDARSRGEKTFDGVVGCKHGHEPTRWVSSGCCVECGKIGARQFRAENPDRYRELVRKSSKKRYADPEIRQQMIRDISRRQGERYRSDPVFALTCRVRRSVRRGLTEGSVSGAIRHLPYSVAELKSHIESQFTDGMTWDAFLAGRIHLDHIIPLAAFSYETPDDPEFQEAWKLDNLRPCWAEENLRKSDKLPDGTRARAA